MRFLTIEEPVRKKLEAMGLRLTSLKDRYPQMTEDALVVDFSGWIVYTHEDTPDDVVEAFCGALEVRKDKIPYRHPDGSKLPPEAPLPLDEMCRDTIHGPLYVPLHKAALVEAGLVLFVLTLLVNLLARWVVNRGVRGRRTTAEAPTAAAVGA